MNYTDKERRRLQRQRREKQKRKRKRARRIRRILTFGLCFLLLFLVYLLFFAKDHKVEEYSNYVYKDTVHKGELYSSQLCVAVDNVKLEGAPSSKNITSAGLFCVEDAKTLYAYNIHEKLYPASLTKLMTALVAFKKGNLDDVVTVSAKADSKNFAYDEKTCGIHAGDQLTLRDLLYGLLLYSGNDNAIAIAEHVGGNVDDFAKMMNEEAKKIMATNSHFVNANGLHDDDHYTTAYDLYLIFNECMKYDEFTTIIHSSTYKPEITSKDGKKVTDISWEPTNLYATGDVARPDNVALVGGKTGTTLKAGNCLILLSKEYKTGKHYISIIMGAESKDTLYKKMTALIKDIPQEKEQEE